MTDMRKPVTRRTIEPHNYRGRRLVVTLHGDAITFREERCQKTYSAPISKVFAQVVKWNVAAERAAKKKKSH